MITGRKTVAVITDQIVKKCEETGGFTFNSRHFCSVGEYELAFDGIYRFVEGNAKFKADLGDDYIWLKQELCPNKDFSRHPIYKWGNQP
jgi:hypothetical protein